MACLYIVVVGVRAIAYKCGQSSTVDSDYFFVIMVRSNVINKI